MAAELMRQADKKAKSKSLMSFFGEPSENAERAVELYEKAAVIYKLGKDYDNAGQAYLKAADVTCNILKEKYTAGDKYQQAGTCFSKVSQKSAENAYLQAINCYVDSGYLDRAARILCSIAEMYEGTDDCLKYYKEALDMYESNGKDAENNKILDKLASYLVLNKDDFLTAANYYERIADYHTRSGILHYDTRVHAKVVLCHLAADDIVTAKKKYEAFCDMHPSFSKLNGKLCGQVISSIERYDTQAFTEAVQEYNSMKPLDRLETRLLLRIKNTIKSEDESLA